MDQSRRHTERNPPPEPDDLARLGDVRAELAEIEALGLRVRDLMAALRARLAPEHFRLTWELLDAAERRAIAERLLGDRILADRLARELPAHSPALRAIRRSLPGGEATDDEAG